MGVHPGRLLIPYWRPSQTWSASCCRVKCRSSFEQLCSGAPSRPLQKKEGGQANRRRLHLASADGEGGLPSRVCTRCTAAQLAPRQFGFGVTGGTEAAVHACRRYVENMPQGHVFVKIDFTNAFNTLRRDVVLEAVESYLPELLPYASASYSGDSDLQFGDFSLQSQEGAQQGDPLGPLYFCLAVHDLLSSLVSRRLSSDTWTTCRWGARAGRVAEDFTLLESGAAEARLLTHNRSKCELPGLPIRLARFWLLEG